MAKKYLKLGEYLRKLLFERNMRPIDLARKTNIPSTTIHRLVTSKSTRPNKATLRSLAEYFSLSVEQLAGEDPATNINTDDTINTKKTLIAMNTGLRSIPILDWDIKQIENPTLHEDKNFVVTGGVSGKAFALIMPDTSMEPTFCKGSILIFDPDKKPNDRSFVLVKLHDVEAPIFRELLIDADQQYLKSHNKDLSGFQIRTLEKNNKILGSLVESRKNFNEP